MDRRVHRGPRGEARLRVAGRPYPADLGLPDATQGTHRRRPRRRRGRAHGALPRGAHRRSRHCLRHGGTRRDELRDRHRQRFARACAGCADRRLRPGPAGRPGTAAGYRPRIDHASGHAQFAHAAYRRQYPARPRQGLVDGDGRRQRAGAGVHRDSDRRIAQDRAARCRPAGVPHAQAAAAHSARRAPTRHARRRSSRRRSGHSSFRAAARWGTAKSSCASSTRAARPISTRRRAAASCRGRMLPSSARCARER